MQARCYLDANASAPLAAEVRKTMAAALVKVLGNPSSAHREGREARFLIEEARAAVAELLGARPEEIVFTSGGTEANATGLWGLAARGRLAAQVIVASTVEHPSVAAMLRQLEELGATLRWIAVRPDGRIDLARLEELLARAGATVVCVQLANSETGVIQPVREIVELTRRTGARVHCDSVQAAGKTATDLAALAVDTLAIASHKVGGPPGVGALAVRTGAELRPLIPGTQERHRRGGTENLPGIVGLGVAARLARDQVPRWKGVAALRDLLESEVRRVLPGTVIHGAAAPRLPNTSCLGLPAPLGGPATVAALDLEGFAVSSGSACSSGVERSSAVAEAMGLSQEAAGRTLRVSLPLTATSRDILGIVAALDRVARRVNGGGA